MKDLADVEDAPKKPAKKPVREKSAIVKAKTEKAPVRVEEEPAAESDGPEDDKPMTFWEHLEELRSRLIRSAVALLVGTGIAWYFKEKILDEITKPFCAAWAKQQLEGECTLSNAAPQQAFTSFARLAVITGVGIAAPFIFYQLWGFIAPGLYQKEKRYVIPFVMLSTALFLGGAWFGFEMAFPFTFNYFLSLPKGTTGVHENFVVSPELYIEFVTQVLLGFGIIFEIPIVLSFLAMVGVVNHKTLIKFARYYILVAFIAAAIFSPPDATSMMVMAIPAVALYFVSIGLVYLVQPKQPKEEDEPPAPKKKKAKKATA